MFKQMLAAAFAAALVVGCATFQPGETVVQYEKDGPLRMNEAPSTGEYALYSGTDLRNPEVRVHLEQGEEIGFVEKDGQVYAVAGDQETPVQTGRITKSYFWRRTDSD